MVAKQLDTPQTSASIRVIRGPSTISASDPPPDYSIVIASISGEATLARCLQSLRSATGGEIIAAVDLCRSTVERFEQAFPNVRFVIAPPGSDVFRLRAIGINAARGDWVALTEDHCTVAPQWTLALRRELGAGHRIVAGPVRLSLAGRPADRALRLCEYAALQAPLIAEELTFVSGVNAAYPKAALDACRNVWRDGFYENEVSDALLTAGYLIRVAPAAWVQTELSMPLRCALAHFYSGGLRFGAYRRRQSGILARIFWAAAIPAVPLVLGTRLLRNAVRNRLRLRSLLPMLPAAILLLAAWSAGEAAGTILPRRE